jgi:hypothetical protein
VVEQLDTSLLDSWGDPAGEVRGLARDNPNKAVKAIAVIMSTFRR